MSKFQFGAVYVIERDYDEHEMRRDLGLMKEHGYNLVTLWPISNPWLASNTQEHIFDHTRLTLDLCEEIGLKAILQLFGQNQSQEFMPDAALTLDMMVHDERGKDTNVNCFWANLNHPLVRGYIDGYFGEAIKAFKDHPAVYGYDVFNEAHFHSDDPYTLKAYQEWLEDKYRTIEALNHAWYRRYDDFTQILIDKRRSPYSVWSSLLPDVDYEKFRSENVTEICQFLYDTAKKYDDHLPIIIDGTSSHILYGDVTIRNNDEFETAKIPDIYGATFYPKSWGRNYRETPWKLSMYYSVPAAAARKAGKQYMINELQTHTQSVLTPGSEVSPSELYDWIWMCIFTGASGIQLWRWRPFLHGYQSTGRGLTYMDGKPNSRASITKELTDVLYSQPELFEDFEPAKAVVKIAVSYSNRLFFDALLKWQDSFWPDNVEGWYKLFWSKGLQAEFLNLEDLSDEDMATKILVLPSILMVSEGAKRKLEAYVKSGGTLVADARLGVFNGLGEVPKEGIPGVSLSRLFGFRERDVSSGGHWQLGDQTVASEFMSQQLEVLEDAEVIARMTDGSPAVIEHAYGKGRTLYFNTFMGLCLLKDKQETLLKAIFEMLIKAKDQVITVDKSDLVHVSYIESDVKKAILVVNFSMEEEVIQVRGLPQGGGLHNLMTDESVMIGEVTPIVAASDTAYVFTY